jgi:hypothetical protein
MTTTPRTRPRRRRTTAALPAGAIAVAFAVGIAPAAPASAADSDTDTALIMGPSGVPIPPQSYVDAADKLYLVPNGYSAYTPQALTTPEQFYPVTGVNSLPSDPSITQGVTILNNAIDQQIASGNRVVVFGYSQSSVVASQEMAQLASSSNPPSPDQLSFVLVGDEDNPNGGIITRFEIPGAPLSLPSLGETFNDAPTASNTYPTAVYAQEYDGFADFPEYPVDILSDLNAYVGVFTQHFGYADLTPQQISSAIALPTTGNTTTQYYMIPTADLPLLDPVRLLPIIGDPLADLLQPDLSVLVNLGYGSITNGWSPGPANVLTPFGLLPTNINPADVLIALANGIPQGVTNALNDMKSPQLFDASSLSGFLAGLHTTGLTPSNNPTLLQLFAGFATLGNAGVPVSSNGGIINTLTSVVSNDIAVVRPLLDTAVALGVTLPKYDAQLFVSQLQAGHLINAVGMPIAADFALAPYAVIFGAVFPVVGAVATTVTRLAELTGLEPNPTEPASAETTNINARRALPTATGASTVSGAGIRTDAGDLAGTLGATGIGARAARTVARAAATLLRQTGQSAPMQSAPLHVLPTAATGPEHAPRLESPTGPAAPAAPGATGRHRAHG